MKTRIKYTKRRDGSLLSQVFMSSRTGAKYKVRLTPSEKRLEVINQGNRNIVKNIIIKGDTPRQLKTRAKSELTKLGVIFKVEMREFSDN